MSRADYGASGSVPIVDQGQRAVAGYTDRDELAYTGPLPVVVFGDHTRIFKLVHHPFVAGADGTKVLVPDTTIFDPIFFYFALCALDIPARGYNRHYAVLKRQSLPCPPLDEQRRVAKVLTAIDLQRRSESACIARAVLVREAVTTRLFSEGIEGTSQNHPELGVVPAGWDLTLLGDLAVPGKGAIVSGPFGSNISSRFFVPTGVPVIRGNNLTLGESAFVDSGFVYITEEKAYELRNCEAVEGDLLFTAAGTIGQVGLIPPGAQFSRYIISNKQLRIRLDRSRILPDFAYGWCASHRARSWLQSQKGGTSIPVINLGVLRRLPIATPALAVQEAIVDILATVDAAVEARRSSLAMLDLVFIGALTTLMGGRS